MPSAQGPFTFEVRATDPSDASLLTAEDLQDNVLSAIPANVTSAANGPAVAAQFQQIVGATWGSYVSALDHYAPLLPLTKGNPSIPLDVLQLAINQAQAEVSTSLSGVAVPTAPGVVLAGDAITATNTVTGDIFQTTILNDGSFVFATVTPGEYTFSASDDLIDGSQGPVTVSAGQAVTGVTGALDPEVVLTGQVTAAATGALVGGASVSVMSGANLVAEATTDGSGAYTIAFIPGSYTLVVQAQGLAPSYSDETFATGVTDKNVALFPESRR